MLDALGTLTPNPDVGDPPELLDDLESAARPLRAALLRMHTLQKCGAVTVQFDAVKHNFVVTIPCDDCSHKRRRSHH